MISTQMGVSQNRPPEQGARAMAPGVGTSKQSQEKKRVSAKTKTIKLKEFIPVDPEEVYDALLNEEKHTAFTGAKATCDRRVGGKFTAWDGYISGTNVRLENGRRIVQEWKTTEWPAGYKPSVLEFSFTPKSGGTEIRMIQKHVPAAQAENYSKGWVEHYWTPLKRYFHGKK
jgi:activator of HSP90 ATPase